MTARIRKDVLGALIEPAFLADVLDVLGAQPDLFVIHFGHRTRAVQQALHDAYMAGGPKAASPEHSAHVGENFPDGLARAVDVTLVRDNADVWDYTDAGWVALIAAVDAHPRLHSGAHFSDSDHIEKTNYRADMIVV
jgi:hypothetical protein